MTLEQVGSWVNAGGVVLLLVGALWGGYKGWWVWGSQYRSLEADRDEWKALAMRGLDLTDVSTKIASKGVLTAQEAQRAQRVVRGRNVVDR